MKKRKIQFLSTLLSLMMAACPIMAAEDPGRIVVDDYAEEATAYETDDETVVFFDGFVGGEETESNGGMDEGEQIYLEDEIGGNEDISSGTDEKDPSGDEGEENSGDTVITDGEDLFSDEVVVVEEGELLNSGTYPESPHNYYNNMNQSWTYTAAGATHLTVTFSSSTYVENRCDYIYVYQGSNAAGTLLGSYTGNALAGQTIEVQGDSVCIRLTSDGSITGYGFAVVSIETDNDVIQSGSCGTNAQYELKRNGELRIWGLGAMANYYSNNFPWYGKEVSSVVIEDGITSIGQCAFFDCDSLSSVELPSSIESIGYEAFYDCGSLNSIELPDGITSIGSCAFEYCTGLSSIVIPNRVTSEGYSVFYGCSNLIRYDEQSDGTLKIKCYRTGITSFEIPKKVSDKTVTAIADEGFYDCRNMGSVKIPNSVTSIGNSAFAYCTSLYSVSIPNSVTSIGDSAFYNCTGLGSITIPEGVTSIGNSAFSGCKYLYSVSIPDSVTRIGDSAFSYCTNLYSVSIPNRVTSMEAYVFSGCTSLYSISIPDGITSISGYAFSGCTNLSSISIPESVTSISSYAFSGCTNLSSISIPESVTSIGSYAFNGCTKLSKFEIPGSITSIEYGTFYGCTGLKSIKIPNSVTSIGNSAFANCSSLGSIVIPNSVTSIEENGYYYSAFYGCSSLIRYDEKSDGTLALYKCYNTEITNCAIPVEVEGKKVTSIRDEAFKDCSKLTSVTVPKTVTSIGVNVFPENTTVADADGFVIMGNVLYKYTGSAANITIPDSVECIYRSAFQNNTTVVSVTIPNSVRLIEEGAFSGCRSLTMITIPGSVDTVAADTFYGCSSLIQVVFQGKVTGIGDRAFYDCDRLKAIVIPNSVTTIGAQAFYSSGLEEITLSDSLCTIGSYAFSDCAITEVTIPEDTESIGSYAFYNCPVLSKVSISDSVISIGEFAFDKCSELKEIEIPESVTRIGYCALPQGTVIYGSSGSQAEKYAEANKNPFYTRLGVVSGFKVTPSGLKEMTATWNKVEGASEYRIEYSTSSNYAKKKAVKVSADSILSQKISFDKVGKYYFRIRAIRTVNGTTEKSDWAKANEVVLGKPKALTGLKATAVGSQEVELTWKKQDGVSKYRIVASSTSTFDSGTIVKQDTKKNKILLKKQKKGTMYYKVRAVTKIGSKEYLGKLILVTVTVK